MNSAELSTALVGAVSEYAPRLVLALIILLAGFAAIKLVVRVIRRTVTRKQVDASLAGFVVSMTRAGLHMVVLITSASTLGIQMTSFVALIGAAGLAIGLAFQGSLSNFAGGVLILTFKPFKVGDFIEASGIMGTVVEIQILYTLLDTFDNKRVTIPNGGLANTPVTNFSVNPTRRLDLSFGISYEDDIDTAKSAISEVISENELILPEPEPIIGVAGHGDSSIDFAVRIWVKRENYFSAMFSMNEHVKKKFDSRGISIPFPQRDIHLYNQPHIERSDSESLDVSQASGETSL